MELLLRDIKTDKAAWREVGALYQTAFPDDERAPFCLLRRRALRGKAQMLAAYDAERFAGFAYLVQYRDLLYLFYFAVAEKLRGQGYGSAILQALWQRFPEKRIFLAREQLDEQAPNAAERAKRRAFYLANGLADWPCQIKEASVIYDVMGRGGAKVTAAEYRALIEGWCGRLMRWLVDMRVLEKAE